MKKIMIAAVALSALSAPAFAATTQNQQAATLELNGKVTARCTTGLPESATFTVGEISNSDGSLNAAVIAAVKGSLATQIVCNGAASTVSVGASPFQTDTEVDSEAKAAGFTNMVDYTVAVTIGDKGYVQDPESKEVLVSDSSAKGGNTDRTVGLIKSSFGIALSGASLLKDATTLVAGDYTSMIVFSLKPAA